MPVDRIAGASPGTGYLVPPEPLAKPTQEELAAAPCEVTARELLRLLGHREIEIRLVHTLDGGAVWDCVLRSLRRVLWRAARADLGDLLRALVERLKGEHV